MEIAVLIITYGRPQLLKRCLDSLDQLDLAGFEPKLYLLINGNDEETAKMLRGRGCGFDQVQAPLAVGEARNRLIERIQKEYICFLDDDVIAPPNYFAMARKFIEDFPEIAIFGGPDLSADPASDFQRTLGLVMQSFFATGPTNKRHKSDSHLIEEADEINLILCNFWAKRKVFDAEIFPKGFRRNEENFLLAKLKEKGFAMKRVPQMVVYHHRKTDIKKLIRVLFLAGVYRSISIVNFPRSAKPVLFVNQAFVATLAATMYWLPQLFFLILAGYLAIIGFEAAKIGVQTKKAKNFFISVILFWVFNFVYPIGQFLGYFKGAVLLAQGRKL